MKINICNIRRGLAAVPVLLICLSLTNCFKDDDPVAEQYREWKAKNEQYVLDAETKTNDDGTPYYERLEPSWAPSAYTLIRWINDPKLTEKNLSPIDNSTVDITYLLMNINGDTISTSFANADSIYRSKPQNNIIGVWYAMTRMHVGDSVELIIPSQAGYGERIYGDIPPYSTLIYHIKMKAVTAYEIP